jgi:actin related protein 2/3 complex subunit 4
MVTRTETEYAYIKTSINSVRISVKVKQLDNVDVLPAKMFMRFLAQRADQFRILRRKSISGYDGMYATDRMDTTVPLPMLGDSG